MLPVSGIPTGFNTKKQINLLRNYLYMKKLPIGIQEFSRISNDDYIYVDKTEYIYNLIHSGVYFFLSRPRRFGKSLLIHTLKEIFRGKIDLFGGLWIYDKLEWIRYPIILLDFSKIHDKDTDLDESINHHLSLIAESYDIYLQTESVKEKFNELIHKLAQIEKVVILIDNYDKPITEYADSPSKIKENRNILRDFYSVLKGNDAYIHFLFITGVSKFSHVFIFSELNNLNDITLNKKYSKLLGFTREELINNFSEYITELTKDYQNIYPEILQEIKNWYDGYSWDGVNFVYNPFSVLKLFDAQVIDNYWFKNGTPNYLLKIIRKKYLTVYDFERKTVPTAIIDKYDIHDINIYSLLFQNGYLTIKNYNLAAKTVYLDYPNKEVESSFSWYLLADFCNKDVTHISRLITEMIEFLIKNEIQNFIEHTKEMYANITYPNVDDKEKYYLTIFYLCLRLFGYTLDLDIINIDTCIESIIKTITHVYILEFKTGDAISAMQQIQDNRLQQKFAGVNLPTVLIAIGFDTTTKNIGGYLAEEVTN
jgi:hypothetical protein